MSATPLRIDPMPAAYKELLGPELVDELDEAILRSTPQELAETIFKIHAAVSRKKLLVRALESLFERVVKTGASDKARLDEAMMLLARDDFAPTPSEESLAPPQH